MIQNDAPGFGGMGAIFTCMVCGQTFVRTVPKQNCCSNCMSSDDKTAAENIKPMMGMIYHVEKSVFSEKDKGTVFCSECGAKNPADSKFCNECGHLLNVNRADNKVDN